MSNREEEGWKLGRKGRRAEKERGRQTEQGQEERGNKKVGRKRKAVGDFDRKEKEEAK